MVAMDEKHHQQQGHQSKPSSSFSSSQSLGREERQKRLEEEEVEVEEDGEILDKIRTEKSKLGKSQPIFLGRHRMTAAISQLNTQITIIQEELNELETVGHSSIVCKELISSLETIPDPLLPTTNGPIDVNWDRWFRGAHNNKSHKRWI